LDDFKRVNDTAGHAAGDAVLIEAAHRLQSVLRAGDSAARVGGDEFVVVLEAAADRGPIPTSPDRPRAHGDETGTTEPAPRFGRDAALQIAERIKSELSRPMSWQGEEYVISVSIGITFAVPGSPAEDLLRDADAAMYRAKQTGRNRVEIFDDSLRAGLLDRAETEHALRTVLTPGREQNPAVHPHLSLLYQPIVDLGSGRLFGFEALPQLTDSAGRSIPLDMVRDVAEHTGTIVALGEQVLDSSLAGLAHWRASHPAYRSVLIAVTFSSVALAQHADLPNVVWAALDRHGLRPSDLGLELTESALIQSGSSSLRQLTQLHASGVGIAINDFGTGYANLHHLATLPVDAIKVDASFTAGLPHDATNAMIVHGIAGLAADMGLACIFAGIDTDEQLGALPPGVIGLGLRLGAPSTVPTYD
jgi:predicted signal transduction protein with EAL and GGDEF domain